MNHLYPPYSHKPHAEGEPIEFPVLVQRAGFKLPISSQHWPEIRIVTGPSFKGWLRPTVFAYCVSIDDIAYERGSREFFERILAKVAYQFNDWMAKEVFRSHKALEELKNICKGK